MTKQEIVQAESNEPILAMIQHAASNPETDVEKLERMFALYERQQAKDAEAAYNEAMNAAQRSMDRVSADATNRQTRSRYASYAALDRALRPIYTSNGFALSFDTGDTEKPDAVRVICYVSHRGGHTRCHHVDIEANGKGIKGNQMMTPTHAQASAMSYGMRYLLKLIFNVAIGEDDDDGNAAGANVERISESQAADLESLIDELGDKLDRKAFDNWLIRTMKVQNADLEQMPVKIYKQVVSMLEQKRKQS